MEIELFCERSIIKVAGSCGGMDDVVGVNKSQDNRS